MIDQTMRQMMLILKAKIMLTEQIQNLFSYQNDDNVEVGDESVDRLTRTTPAIPSTLKPLIVQRKKRRICCSSSRKFLIEETVEYFSLLDQHYKKKIL